MFQDDWLERVITSATTSDPELPGFPPEKIQMRFVGSTGEKALREVVPFLRMIETVAPDARTVLDFGAGWGRIARFFQDRDVLLVDVDAEALEVCKDTGVKGQRLHIAPDGRLPVAPASVDVAYAYSVFSHLSESSTRHWLRELHAALKPGGAVVFTTLSLRFIDLVAACAAKPDANKIERQIGGYLPNAQRSREQFEAGQHVFSGTGGGGVLSGSYYGWAAIPQPWLEHTFGREFEIVGHVDDPAVQEQAMFALKKR